MTMTIDWRYSFLNHFYVRYLIYFAYSIQHSGQYTHKVEAYLEVDDSNNETASPSVHTSDVEQFVFIVLKTKSS